METTYEVFDGRDAQALNGDLPPLPEPAFRTSTTGGAFDHEQMRAYGRAAIAAAREIRRLEPPTLMYSEAWFKLECGIPVDGR